MYLHFIFYHMNMVMGTLLSSSASTQMSTMMMMFEHACFIMR